MPWRIWGEVRVNRHVPDSPEWVGLREACRILGVHEATLRRWTDRGLVAAFRTPGGHRRYLRSDLLAFLARSRTQVAGAQLEHLAERTLSEAQHALAQRLVGEPWSVRYEPLRSAKRASGRQLLGLLIQYAGREAEGEPYLEAAREIVRRYGEEAFALGLSIPETARAVLTFRQVIMEAIAHAMDRPPAHDPDGWRVMRRAGAFFDELLVATLEGYLQPAGPRAAPLKEAAG